MAGPAVVTIPRRLVRQSQVFWGVDWGGQQAPEAIDRSRQLVRNKASRIFGRPRMVLSGEDAAQFRATIWAVEGRTNVLRIPVVDPLAADPRLWSAADQAALADGVPFDNGSEFADGSRWGLGPSVVCISAVAAGATSIDINESGAPAPVRVGSFLSYNDRPFLVLSREQTGATVTLGIKLLRTSIPEGGAIDLLAHGIFRLEDDLQGQAAYTPDHVTRPSLNVLEYLNR